MKYYFLCSLLLLCFQSHGQCNISGTYFDCFGGRLQINSDSTFKYEESFDMYYSWTKGKWKLDGQRISFIVMPIYDTVRINNDKANVIFDTIILSDDEKSQLYTDAFGLLANHSEQDVTSCPKKLYFKENKLFFMSKTGTLIRKRKKNDWANVKHYTWFVKVEDSNKIKDLSIFYK